MKQLLVGLLAGIVGFSAAWAGKQAEDRYPSFFPVETRLKDSDIPVSRCVVTPEEIDDLTETAGWGVFSRGIVHEMLSNVAGLQLMDKLQGVELPHAAWAKPWVKGPMKVLVIAELSTYGDKPARQIVELAQRLDGEVITALHGSCCDYTPADQEVFTRMILSRLEKTNPDVILFSIRNPTRLPAVIAAVKKRVEAGTGLVITIPEEKRTPDVKDTSVLPPEKWPAVPYLVDVRTWNEVKADWIAEGEPHFIWSGLPYGGLPTLRLPRVIYPGVGWEVLAKVGGNPWILSKMIGKGRVVALLTTDYLLPRVESGDWKANQEHRILDDRTSVVLKSLLWAAGKESGVLLNIDIPKAVSWNQDVKVKANIFKSDMKGKGKLTLSVQDDVYHEVFSKTETCALEQGAGIEFSIPALGKNGRYFVNAVLRDQEGKSVNWHSAPVFIKDGMELAVEVNQEGVFKPADTLKARIAPKGDITAFAPFELVGELWDSYGRLVARNTRSVAKSETQNMEVKLETGLAGSRARVMMVVGRVVAGDRVLAETEKEIFLPVFGLEDDYHVVAWANPPAEERAGMHLQLLKRLGFDTSLIGPWRPQVGSFRMTAWNNMNFMLENAFHLSTCFSDKNWPGGGKEYDTYFEKVIDPCASLLRKYGCLLMSISNEAHYYKGCKEKIVTAIQEAMFKAYLKEVYGNIEALNREWESEYKSFEEIKAPAFKVEGYDTMVPVEKTASLNFSRMIDWRMFFDQLSVKEQKRGIEEYFRLMGGICPWGSTSGGSTELQAEAGASFHGNTMGDGFKSGSGREPGWYDLWHHGTTGSWGYMGYDWPQENYEFYPWYNLFHGGKTEFIYLSGGAAGLEGAFTRRGLWTKEYEAGIRAGIGKLLATSVRENDAVAMFHSDLAGHIIDQYASAVSDDKYAGQFYGRFAKSSLFSFTQLFIDAQIHPTFVTAKGVESGALKEMKMLFLCNVPGMSEKTASAIRQFAENGGIVVADMCPAIFDEHGKMLPKGRLDDFFGVGRKSLKVTAYPAEYTLGILEDTQPPYYLPHEWFYVEFHETDIQVTDGKALGKHIIGNEAPAFVFKKQGKGASLYLNYLDSQYRKNRDPRHLNFMRALLKWGGVKPEIEITDGFVPLRQFDVVKFRDDKAIHAAIIRDDTDSRKGPEVVLNFERSAHAYDVREGRYLGEGKSFKAEVPRWKPKLISLLPCRIDGVKVNGNGSAKVGGKLRFKIETKIQGEPTSLVYRLEVKGPDGELREAYSSKVRTPAGSSVYDGVLPLALNDPTGAWTITATEIVSGKSGQITFNVK